MGESYWWHPLLIKELEFLVLISFVSDGFFNRRGKRLLFAILKSEVRVSKSFHIPLVMIWIHYRFGLLSTQSNLLSSLSFGKTLPHAMSPSWGFQLLGHAPLLQHRKNMPWAGPPEYRTPWAPVTSHHTSGQRESPCILFRAESWMLGPTNSLSVGTANLGRWQCQAARGHLTDHMPVWRITNQETSRAEKVQMRSSEFLAAPMPEARCTSGNHSYVNN